MLQQWNFPKFFLPKLNLSANIVVVKTLQVALANSRKTNIQNNCIIENVERPAASNIAFLVWESRISQVRANIFWWESLTDIQKPSDVFSIYYNWLHYGKTLDAAFCSKSKCLEAVKCNAL